MTLETLNSLVGTGTAIHIKNREELAEFCKMARRLGFEMKEERGAKKAETFVNAPISVWLHGSERDEWDWSAEDCKEWRLNDYHNGKSVEFSESKEPQPLTPKFKVGDKVIYGNEKMEISELVTVYRMKEKALSMTFSASEIRLAPKTKKVFSLEKWVEDRMKLYGAGKVIKFIDLYRLFDGKEESELNPVLEYPENCFVEVEVEEKQ
jgi:hypothetical protein